MAKKTEQMKLAEMQRNHNLVMKVLDLFGRNPIAQMITGVVAVNALAKVKDEQGNPQLFSEGVRIAMQTAAIGFPTAAGIAGLLGGSQTAPAITGAVTGGATALTTTAASTTAATAKTIAGSQGNISFLPFLLPKSLVKDIQGGNILGNSQVPISS